MFHAIRHWWTDGRGKLTARLFVFEFVVVVAGVLVAQWAAAFAQERSDRAAMEREKIRMEGQIANGVASAQAWMIAVPCLDSQLVNVMKAAGDDRPVDPALLDRPAFRSDEVNPMSTDSALLMTDRHGAGRTQLYFSIQQRTMRSAELSERMAEKWLGLGVVDPRNGSISEGDRVNARAVASELRSALRSISISQRGLIEEAAKVGIGPVDIQGRRRPRDCADIRQAGSMMPPR